MQELLNVFGSWTWWVVAGIFLLLELAFPGMFFIWLGFAAVGVGFIGFLIALTWQIQLVLFAILSIVLVLAARPWFRRKELAGSDRPNLNRRMHAFVGRSFVLEQPIANGRGRLSIEGTWWEIQGPDQPKGEWVKVKRVEDMRLIVEPVPGPT
jgi:membrane protein implicated in regulation of membrane protease activity